MQCASCRLTQLVVVSCFVVQTHIFQMLNTIYIVLQKQFYSPDGDVLTVFNVSNVIDRNQMLHFTSLIIIFTLTWCLQCGTFETFFSNKNATFCDIKSMKIQSILLGSLNVWVLFSKISILSWCIKDEMLRRTLYVRRKPLNRSRHTKKHMLLTLTLAVLFLDTTNRHIMMFVYQCMWISSV